jgi:hypothetical protein
MRGSRPTALGSLDAQEADLRQFRGEADRAVATSRSPAVREHRLAKRELAETRACQERQLRAEPRDAESFGRLLRRYKDDHGHGGYPVMYMRGPAPCR